MRQIKETRILFITDDRDAGKMVQIFLRERRNDKVVIFNPKGQSLRDFIHEEPDLILLTADSLDFNTLQIYQELRTTSEFEKTPVISWRILETPAEFYPKAQKLGAAGYIPYVFDIENHFLVARDKILAGGTYYPTDT
jgi:DNA-binding response OmpR family regulator